MDIKYKKDHDVRITMSYGLYEQLKKEHNFDGEPTASYGVIGKLIEIFERRLTSVALTYKGK
jgi:hypothetical protein